MNFHSHDVDYNFIFYIRQRLFFCVHYPGKRLLKKILDYIGGEVRIRIFFWEIVEKDK